MITMTQLGNVGIGRMFYHENALFVVAPFNWEEERYLNLCVATFNETAEFTIGEEYYFGDLVEVEEIDPKKLKKVLDNLRN